MSREREKKKNKRLVSLFFVKPIWFFCDYKRGVLGEKEVVGGCGGIKSRVLCSCKATVAGNGDGTDVESDWLVNGENEI